MSTTTAAVLLVRAPAGELHEETAGGLTACGRSITSSWRRPEAGGWSTMPPTCSACNRVRERAAAYLAALAGGTR